MSSPIFNAMGNKMPGGNIGNMLQAFKQFQANFRGDPRQQVQQLLNSGQMSQDQYNQLSQMAQQMMNMFK